MNIYRLLIVKYYQFSKTHDTRHSAIVFRRCCVACGKQRSNMTMEEEVVNVIEIFTVFKYILTDYA